jgi:hypothetical protein
MRRSSLFWGIVLVLIGGILLLDNLGFFARFNISVWALIWPLFLIALGVWILAGSFFRGSSEMEHAVVRLEGASRARVRVQHGAGRLVFGAGGSPDALLEGDFGGGVVVDPRRSGDTLEATLKTATQLFPFMWAPGTGLNWNVSLNRDIPLELKLEVGACETRLDLSDLKVTDLRVESGASSTEVTLPANAGATRARFQTGAASVRIQVPPGVAAHIRTSGALSSTRIDEARFPRLGEAYQSPDYGTAANRADIEIEMGVGSVEVL